MANNFRTAQLQPFTLSGSGATSGATSFVLQSMTDIDGNALSMSGTFGSKGFGTLEPGNGTLEEQIVFTGLTNNSNGTVTLSGVSSVSFTYPYTETSGLAKTHAGSTSFVISNTSGFYDQFVAKDDDGTISEVLTFSVPNYPKVDDSTTYPTDQAQFATKAYADSLTFAGAPNATTSVKGIIQLPTQAQVDAGTTTGSTGASLVPTPALLRSKLLSDYATDTGVADAYAIAPSPAITAYTTGQIFSFKAAHTNTTASTLAVNGLTTKAITKRGTTALQAGDIIAGQIIVVEYDGTEFQLVNPSAIGLPAISSSNINEFVGTTDGAAFAFGRPFDYQSFTASNTWTKPTNLSGNEVVMVQLWGGGGAGGGATGSNGAAGGGGGGAYVQAFFRASDLTSTVTVTVGAAVAGTTTNGTVGNNSTFGSYVTAYGGGGGANGGGQSGGGGGGGGALGVGQSVTSTSAGNGGAPGAASGATDGWAGAGGSGASAGYGGGGGGTAGGGGQPGGSSLYGGGGGGGSGNSTYGGGTSVFGGAGGTAAISGTTGNGTAGTAPGGGGGGAARDTSGSGTGGGGARGECRVWTFL